MKIFDHIYECIILGVLLIPVWALIEKHGIGGFISLAVDTFTL
jgi:hypothetical protein